MRNIILAWSLIMTTLALSGQAKQSSDSTALYIKKSIEIGITSQMKSIGVYDNRLEEILVIQYQSQLSTKHPEFSAYVGTLPYSMRFFNLSQYSSIEELIADVVEKTFAHHASLFPDAVNADPRHVDSPNNKYGYRYDVIVEDVGNGSYKINTVIAPDRNTTERGY